MKIKLKKILSAAVAVLLTAAIGVPTVSALPSDVKIESLHTDYAESPVGIDSPNPVFSWKMTSDARGILQTAYQITVREGAGDGKVVWDSEKTEDGRSVNIEYAGEPLKSQTAYYWSVTVWDNFGGKTESYTARFETGLYNSDDWSGAKWLRHSPNGGDDEGTSGPAKYIYETDFQITRNNMGLIFSGLDTSSFYMWAVNTDKEHPYLRRHIFSNGNVSYVEDITLPEQFTKETLLNSEHNIKIKVEGNTVTTLIDGIKADVYTDTSGGLVEGLVGVRFHNEGARFDNMKCTAYDEAGNERILLEANFDDGVNPFTAGSIVTVGGSKKLLVESTDNEIRVFEKSVSEPKDIHYTYDFDFQIVRDNMGVSFAAENTGNFYMWAINTKDASRPYLRRHIFTNNSAGNVQDIPLPTQFTAASLKNSEHHLKIEVEGNIITTSIDNVVVDTYTDTVGALCEGYFGFRFHNEAARVDNVKAVSYRGIEETVLIDADFENGINPFGGGNIVDQGGNKKLYFESSGEVKILENRISAASMFRKDFTAQEKTVKSARLYASALGVSDYYINGVRVGTPTEEGTVYDELKPGWTDYDDTVFYLTYDVTDLIKQGNNAIGAEVASGWYNGVIAVRGGSTYSGLDNGLMMKLDITYSDGSIQTVVTDSSWKTLKDGAVRYADIYNGEVYDANKDSISEWSAGGYDDKNWYPAAIKNDYRGKVMAAIGSRVQARYDISRDPVEIVKYSGVKENGTTYGEIDSVTNPEFPFELKRGETVIFDLGQNIAGWEQFNITGNKNTVVDIHFGEMLNDSGEASRKNDGPMGSVYNANYLEARASGQYIMKGDAKGESYNPRFTFYGFRYIEITASDDVTINSVKGIVVGNANEENSSFETSDASVNQLYSNIIWGQRCNFLSTATDCPQRNERLGWTADTHIFSRTATYNSDAVGFYRKWLQDMRDSQFGPEAGNLEGAYPDVAPNTHIVGGGNGGWAEAGIIVPYNVYLMYGDTQLIKDHFASMEKFMDYLKRHSDENNKDGWNYNGGGAASGDWVSPELNDDNVKRYISVTYYAYSAQLMVEMSEAIGNSEAKEKYEKLAEDIKAEFNTRYVNEDGSLKVASQTTYLLALKLDLYATEELKEKGLEILLKKIEDNGNRLSTGFIGTSILNQTLSDVGASDMAYTLLLQHNYPSWLYSVDQGATTIWENWDSYTIEKGFKDPGMNSFNHYAYGAVGEFMYRYMAGIEADEKNPGFKNFILQPTLDSDNRITYVNSSYDSIYGEIKSSWQTDEDGRISYEATVPANTTATLYLPVGAEDDIITVDGKRIADTTGIKYLGIKDGKAVIELGSGSYRFNVIGKDSINVGDVDENGYIDVNDMSALKALVMSDGYTEKQLLVGDIDRNNVLDVNDMSSLKAMVMSAGME